MPNEHKIIGLVYAAKNDTAKADDLIRAYIPFIRREASKCMKRACTDSDDEYSIALMAFYEAIMGYEKDRGAFLGYASMLIHSRLTDYARKEMRHQGNVSLYEEKGDGDGTTLADTLADGTDVLEERALRDATRQEIEELANVMKGFGISFSDVADNCPKQERTLRTCTEVIRYAGANPHILDLMLQTKKLPLAELVKGSGAERKTLERHRKYLLAMLLILTNGYELIRGHLKCVLKRREGKSV